KAAFMDYALCAKAPSEICTLSLRDALPICHRLRPGDQSRFHYELAAPHLKPHFRVLEAACGDGAGTRFLAERVAELVAVDLEAGQLPRLRGLRARKAPGVALAADASRLPFPDASFDAIPSFETIQHSAPEACPDSFARVPR